MDQVAGFRRLFRYDDWANREVLTGLEALPEPPPRAVELLAHILAARRRWLARLAGVPPTGEVWPDATVARCAREWDDVEASWRHYTARLTEEELGRTIQYTNTKGEPWRSVVADVLTHVVMHGAYHRGQIARDLRSAGYTPPYTDFIHAVRQGRVAD
jgi:uncharacterized damage-inducible protein DinB